MQIETEERTSADIVSCITAGVAQAGGVRCGRRRAAAPRSVADDPLVLIVPPARSGRKTGVCGGAQRAWSPSIDQCATAAEQHAAELGGPNVRVRMSHLQGFARWWRTAPANDPAARYAERYRQRCSFAVIGLQDRWAQRRLCLCYQDDASLSPAMRRLLEWLRQP